MDLQKILDYQTVDMQLFKLEMALRNSDAGKSLAASKSEMAKKAGDIQKCVKDADEVKVIVEKYREIYKKIAFEMSELSDVLEHFEEPKEIDRYEKQIDQSKKKLLEIEKELTKLVKKMDECVSRANESLVKYSEFNKTAQVAMKKLNEMKASMQNEAKELNEKLKELKKVLPENFIEKYNNIKKNGKMPVLVEGDTENKICKGCRMELYNKELEMLDGGKLVECPNCGRILYKK